MNPSGGQPAEKPESVFGVVATIVFVGLVVFFAWVALDDLRRQVVDEPVHAATRP
jgi:hypothetical protein